MGLGLILDSKSLEWPSLRYVITKTVQLELNNLQLCTESWQMGNYNNAQRPLQLNTCYLHDEVST